MNLSHCASRVFSRLRSYYPCNNCGFFRRFSDQGSTQPSAACSDPLDGAREQLAALLAGTPTFVATNQGGPAFRAVLGQAKYPTVADVVTRLADSFRALMWWPDLLLICCCSGREGAAWWRAEAAAAAELDPLLKDRLPGVRCSTFVTAYYHKPQPGMLIAARGVGLDYRSDAMIYIGDMESDKQAAAAAHCTYQDAGDWRMGDAPID